MKPFGIDVSRHKGKLNWHEIEAHENDPVEFAAMRAGISYAYEDDSFERNWKGCAETAIYQTAYHVLYPGESIFDQVGNFHSIVSDEGIGFADFPMVADIELHHDKSKMEVANAIEMYLIEIERVFGVKPIIYSAAWFFNAYVDPSFINKLGDNYYWWIANYGLPGVEATFEPMLPRGLSRDRVIIHQTSDSMPSIGGTGVMDYNRFIGTGDQWFDVFGLETEPTEPDDCCDQIAAIRAILEE